MSVEFRYPVGGPHTATWSTTAGVTFDGSGLERDRGINAEQMADRRTIRTYREADPSWGYTLSLGPMPYSEAEDLEDFADDVGGDAFEYRDTCAPYTDWRTVQFAVDGYKPKYTFRGGGRVSTTILLVDADEEE